MKKLNSDINKLFWWALGLSVGFPVGVVCIVFGAVNHQFILMAFGIVLAIAGFYVMPILWVQFGEKKGYKSLLLMIENDYLYSVAELSAQTGKPENKIREMIKYAIFKQYLTGYLFKDDVLTINNNIKQTKQYNTKQCPTCGAKMHFKDDRYVCDYCGK